MSTQVLIGLLQEELNRLEGLGQALQEEYLALCQKQALAIESAAEKKQAAITSLEAVFHAHEERLRISGLPSAPEKIRAHIRACAAEEHSPLATLWEQWQGRLRQCREQNQFNGNLMNRSRHHTLRTLAILNGQDLKSTAYGPEGDLLSPAPASRSLLGRV